MARKYSKSASSDVKRAMRKRKKGTLKSGRSGKKVKSRKQAIAIGLSEARRKGKKVPKKKSSRRKRSRSGQQQIRSHHVVMAGLVPAIHVFEWLSRRGCPAQGRHDESECDFRIVSS